MRLLLDARKIEDYGIGVYIRHVFGGLLRHGFEDIQVLHLAGASRLNVEATKEIRIRAKNYNLWEQVEIPWKVRSLKNYLYFSPHYVFPVSLRQRLVVTVHDLIHFKFPWFFRPGVKVRIARFFLQQIRSRAELVFTVSETTARDLAEMFSIPIEIIKIIHNGVAQEFFTLPRFPSPLPFPYILYVGNWKPHKNLPTLLHAFSLLHGRYPELRLVLVGLTREPELRREIARWRLEESVLPLGFLPPDEVIRYLDGALFFVFPSLYEGFGLPPLEAMARGRAVISSPGGSLSEVLGEAALFFDPASAEDLAAKMEQLITDETLRQSYEEKGKERSRLFSWERSIAQHIHFLEQLD